MSVDSSTRVAWATDLHFDCAEADVVMALVERIRTSGADALLVGGDTTTALDLEDQLRDLADMVAMPVHFVLGNHDYYGGSVAGVRNRARALDRPGLRWLPAAGPQELAAGVSLVGHGGWGDAGNGDFPASDILLTDYFAIEELAAVFSLDDYRGVFGPDSPLQRLLGDLGRDAADTLEPHLAAAARTSRQVVVLTHVPPFREASWYEGRISDDRWLPSMSCAALGRMIAKTAREHPGVGFTVLCGHTHGAGQARIADNLVVHTQGARYESPSFVLLEMDGAGTRFVQQ
jgi:3',5'-cyclic AMP phosphodiesterase CpdA